ncbi:MAG TPA: transglycosylase SLT domain-containing protein [Aliidongia sp.]|uniref:lytic transglycosylase domain-containing protein n=1 Tax=Aliidongia sp. TaxID=1914230 RepID=UPI002DDC9011|nr:transglycosylase SLT domain-containing protein [Aliidongia sp.]HEV2674164.1 transglycosylase SLT domain-containing protein [Aliidongia sp.]
MAVVNDESGIPTVTPQDNLPNDYLNVQSNPNQFGAQIGQGEEKLGAGALTAGKFFGQVAADNATNGYQDAASKILHGDPNKMVPGPDGQMQPDTGYLGLRGRAALDARPQVEQQLDDLMTQTRSGLQTPDQELQFDNFSRRYRSYLGGQIGSHADQQANQWYGEVNQASANLALNHIATNADNPDEVNHGTADLMSARIKQAQLQGGGDQLVSQALASSRQDAVKAQVEALAVKNPMQAMSVLDQNKDAAGQAYEPLAQQLRTRVNQQVGVTVAKQAIAEAGSNMGGVPNANGLMQIPNASPQSVPIKQAILGQESGNNSNVASSINGAVGPGQIMPATFAAYAQPGESITNPADNRAVSGRIIDDLSAKFGGDPERIAVGYFSGPGNVAPPGSPTPWINNRIDGNGKSVSSYVSDVMQRTGVAGTGSSLKAGAYDRVLSMTADNPEAQRIALSYVNEQSNAANVAAMADAKARTDASNQAANGYVTKILTGNAAAVVPAIAQDPNLTWETKERLTDIADKHMKGEIDHDTKSYGPGFWDAYKSVTAPQGDPTRIADQNQILRRAGPGGDLSLSGAEKLIGVMQGKGTAEGEAESQLQKQFFLSAKNQLSGADDGMHIKDPKGDQLYLTFMTQAFPAIQAAKAAGKSTSEIYDPNGPIAKLAEPLKRNPAQRMADMMQGGDVAARGLKDIIADVQANKISSDAGKAEAIRLGLVAPDAAAAPTVPVMQ